MIPGHRLALRRRRHPAGSDVLSATVQFTAAADASEPVAVDIVGEAADSALPFSAAVNDLTARKPHGRDGVLEPPDWTAGKNDAPSGRPTSR